MCMISLKYYTSTYTNQALLHLAAKSGHKKVFDILQSFDANDFRDNDERTAEITHETKDIAADFMLNIFLITGNFL